MLWEAGRESGMWIVSEASKEDMIQRLAPGGH